jgi:hypothetical protein
MIALYGLFVLMFTGMTRRELQTLPAGISLFLNDAIYSCRKDPPSDWPESAYRLIVRQDLAAHCCQSKSPGPASGSSGSSGSSGNSLYSHLPQTGTPTPNGNEASRKTAAAAASRVTECEQDDGMETMDQEVSTALRRVMVAPLPRLSWVVTVGSTE